MEMTECFKTRDIGLPGLYLCIEVKQNNARTIIYQEVYADKLLAKAGMAGCNPTTMSTETCMVKAQQGEHTVAH
jgi:hypothetical protein